MTIFALFENICCDPSLESSWRDGSNDGSHHVFLWENEENYTCHPLLYGAQHLYCFFVVVFFKHMYFSTHTLLKSLYLHTFLKNLLKVYLFTFYITIMEPRESCLLLVLQNTYVNTQQKPMMPKVLGSMNNMSSIATPEAYTNILPEKCCLSDSR